MTMRYTQVRNPYICKWETIYTPHPILHPPSSASTPPPKWELVDHAVPLKKERRINKWKTNWRAHWLPNCHVERRHAKTQDMHYTATHIKVSTHVMFTYSTFLSANAAQSANMCINTGHSTPMYTDWQEHIFIHVVIHWYTCYTLPEISLITHDKLVELWLLLQERYAFTLLPGVKSLFTSLVMQALKVNQGAQNGSVNNVQVNLILPETMSTAGVKKSPPPKKTKTKKNHTHKKKPDKKHIQTTPLRHPIFLLLYTKMLWWIKDEL